MRERPRRPWQLRLLLFATVLAVLLLPRAAPGTVTEQRARLPPPAECKDGVEGTWRAHIYSSRFRDWHVHTLYIRRVEGSDLLLIGRQTSEVWDGGPEDEDPGPCRGRTHYRVKMPSKGRIEKGEIQFRGTSLEIDQVLCGRYVGYNVDNFSGRIDPERQEFQSVNNDGGRAVNEPTVFRRVGCWDEDEDPAPKPSLDVKPPAFYPKRDGGGCGCSQPGLP